MYVQNKYFFQTSITAIITAIAINKKKTNKQTNKKQKGFLKLYYTFVAINNVSVETKKLRLACVQTE
jgi:hypothetical protein